MNAAQQRLQQRRKEGDLRRDVAIAKNMLAEGMSPQAVQRLTGLSENEVMELVNKH